MPEIDKSFCAFIRPDSIIITVEQERVSGKYFFEIFLLSKLYIGSFAKTEPEEKVSAAVPAAFTRKFKVIIFPAEPVKPGLGTIPSKFTVPP